jgi:uncharacterized membrane protein
MVGADPIHPLLYRLGPAVGLELDTDLAVDIVLAVEVVLVADIVLFGPEAVPVADIAVAASGAVEVGMALAVKAERREDKGRLRDRLIARTPDRLVSTAKPKSRISIHRLKAIVLASFDAPR